MKKWNSFLVLFAFFSQMSFAMWGGNPEEQEELRQLQMSFDEKDEEQDPNIQHSPPAGWYDHEQGTAKNETTRQWGKAAPAYRVHCHGANLIGWHDHQGKRTNVVCKHLGYGSFEVLKAGTFQIDCRCVDLQCNDHVLPVTAAFNNCKFRIKQRKSNGTNVTTLWRTIGNECLIFNEENNQVPVTRLVIECKQVSEPTEDDF